MGYQRLVSTLQLSELLEKAAVIQSLIIRDMPEVQREVDALLNTQNVTVIKESHSEAVFLPYKSGFCYSSATGSKGGRNQRDRFPSLFPILSFCMPPLEGSVAENLVLSSGVSSLLGGVEAGGGSEILKTGHLESSPDPICGPLLARGTLL